EKGFAVAWNDALDKVGESSEGVIARRLREIRPQQEAIALRAAKTIDVNIRGIGDQIPKRLHADRNLIVSQSRRAIEQQAGAATARTGAQIVDAKQRVAR